MNNGAKFLLPQSERFKRAAKLKAYRRAKNGNCLFYLSFILFWSELFVLTVLANYHLLKMFPSGEVWEHEILVGQHWNEVSVPLHTCKLHWVLEPLYNIFWPVRLFSCMSVKCLFGQFYKGLSLYPEDKLIRFWNWSKSVQGHNKFKCLNDFFFH